ncbi:hypothetical protein PCC9214_03053 [Planktothrix tepida]|nr:hypothetical protein PCC9214_03053 [Planktothrix tepida]
MISVACSAAYLLFWAFIYERMVAKIMNDLELPIKKPKSSPKPTHI